MKLFELLLLAVGLSMDALAVALCKGLAKRKPDPRQGVILSAYFGFFQAFMPLIGFFLGRQFERHITAVDHWIAFILLLLIGGKMILSFARGGSCDLEQENGVSVKEYLTLAVATSIDALAVGITFAFLQVEIVPAVLIIGLTTWSLSLAGYLLGNRLGPRFGGFAELGGGIVLILIGSKILLEHLGIIRF